MRKVNVKVTVDLLIRADEGVSIDEVINEMEYNFTSNTEGADIEDTTIEDSEVTDSR
jgi:ribosomal protein L12E/L44/L45/RPP1/RPP2